MIPLHEGDAIQIIATAGTVEQKRFDPSIQVLKSWTLHPTVSSNVLARKGYFAGSDAQRLNALQQALDNPGVKAVFCARGGYGTTRLIDQIDYTEIKRQPKWVIGFSDVTALHLKLSALGIPSIHGAMPIQFGNEKHKESVALLRHLLFEGSYSYKLPSTHAENRQGTANGLLTGGNLALICDSIGTSNEIQTEGKILFIEEIGEEIYRVDRMFHQLKRAGKLDSIAGIIFGHFTDIRDSNPSFELSMEEMILPLVPDNIPVVFDFPAGHEAPNYPLVMHGYHSLLVNDTIELNYSGN